jgi:hypothetical protein
MTFASKLNRGSSAVADNGRPDQLVDNTPRSTTDATADVPPAGTGQE